MINVYLLLCVWKKGLIDGERRRRGMMMMMENNTEEDTIEPRNTKRLKWDLQQSHHKNKGASGSFCSFPEDV